MAGVYILLLFSLSPCPLYVSLTLVLCLVSRSELFISSSPLLPIFFFFPMSLVSLRSCCCFFVTFFFFLCSFAWTASEWRMAGWAGCYCFLVHSAGRPLCNGMEVVGRKGGGRTEDMDGWTDGWMGECGLFSPFSPVHALSFYRIGNGIMESLNWYTYLPYLPTYLSIYLYLPACVANTVTTLSMCACEGRMLENQPFSHIPARAVFVSYPAYVEWSGVDM